MPRDVLINREDPRRVQSASNTPRIPSFQQFRRVNRRMRVVVALSRARRSEVPANQLLRVASPVASGGLQLNEALKVGSCSEDGGFSSRIASF